MQVQIKEWLLANNITFYTDHLSVGLVALGLIIAAFVIYYVAYILTRRLLQKVCVNSRFIFLRRLGETKLFVYINYLLVSLVINKLAQIWFEPGVVRSIAEVSTESWTLLIVLFISFALLDTLTKWCFDRGFATHFPVRGLVQTLKILISIGIGISIISILIGQSPLIILSGMGAMTAVLMLVFKDPILGLVAGIQLSANNMLNLGDWLEMSKYNADGSVIDIGLTTVKVQNWDNTITTIPTYALISDSFKNWRGMTESGGRRIKRAIMIDASSVHFISEEDVSRLTKSPLLAEYIITKSGELEEANKTADLSLRLNGRRLTNIGTFRAYLVRYLKNHPKIRQDLTIMVRQLAPTSEGIPLEIYCFSNDVAWVNYEDIQSDIFDHIFAVVSEFDLRIYQNPTGYDMREAFAQHIQ
ncbi:mechanosensitive ion channel [Pelistega sp. NLN82]|uniref:Mechanosensing system component YbdG n=1 Tax=Pelistega ratti TaxID=2652177 RepID=A0A6L9Y390_9BURK|nr:mechanosensitive ion channel domain-containing protein [Pelistega ratti]NEN74839.1 mechanosensitive ion channel [Pelistega ratti]